MTTQAQRQKALLGGSVVVAALSSACCWLPLLAVGLGFSAVGIGSVLEAYRWPLVGLAGAFMVGVLLMQRRALRACERQGCPPPRGRAWIMPTVGVAFLVVFAVFPEVLAWARSGGAAEAREPDVAAVKLVRTYSVEGMTCEGCTSLLVSYLEDQPEINSATVTYAEATARIEFVEGTTAARADRVMGRVSADWEGKYLFKPKL